MKKFIAAGAGLMLATSMVSTAFADIAVTGDARARYHYESNYVLNDSTEDRFDSRVRLHFDGSTESGVYATLGFEAVSSPWQEDAIELGVSDGFFGVPLGPVALEAGRINTHLTDMVMNDVDTDGARLVYNDDMHSFTLHYSQTTQNGVEVEVTPMSVMPGDEEDSALLGAYYVGNLEPAEVTFGLFHQGSEGDDDGMFGTVRVAFDLGMVSGSVDYAYYEEALTPTPNDGHAAYATVSAAVGDAGSVTLVGGLTMDGAVMDAPVGFMMLGGDHMIMFSEVGQIPSYVITDEDGDGVWDTAEGTSHTVDTTFGGLIASYEVAEGLTVTGTAAYAQMKSQDDPALIDTTGFELGGKVEYAVNADTTFGFVVGYLNIDDFDNDIIGAGAELKVSF